MADARTAVRCAQLPLVSLRGEKRATAGLMSEGSLHQKAIPSSNSLLGRTLATRASSVPPPAAAPQASASVPSTPTPHATQPEVRARSARAGDTRASRARSALAEEPPPPPPPPPPPSTAPAPGLATTAAFAAFQLRRKYKSRDSREEEEEARALPLSVFSKGKYSWTPTRPAAARAKPAMSCSPAHARGSPGSLSSSEDEERRRRMRMTKGRNSIRLVSKNATSILKEFDRAGQDRRRSQMSALKSSLGGLVDGPVGGRFRTTDRSGSAFGESGRRTALSRRSSATLFGIEEEANQDLDMSGSTPASRSRAKRMSMCKATLQEELNNIRESEDRESRRRMRRSSSLVNASTRLGMASARGTRKAVCAPKSENVRST